MKELLMQTFFYLPSFQEIEIELEVSYPTNEYGFVFDSIRGSVLQPANGFDTVAKIDFVH